MSRKEIKVLHETTVHSPILADFPPSQKYIKTLVTPKTTKTSEFYFELSIKEGEILELDCELISTELKKAVMSCGTLPTDWLVCLTPAGEKRLIRRALVTRVEENQARLLLLKRASEKLLDSLFRKECTSEIGVEIHELIGNNGLLMKHFADQLIEALKGADSARMKAMAAYALNHYMLTNKDLVKYVEAKVDHFVKFVNQLHCDQDCPPELITNVLKILEDWCQHFDTNKSDLTKLLNDVTAENNFQKAILKIIQSTVNFKEGETKEKLKESVQRVSTSYLQKSERIDQLSKFLLERFQKAKKDGEMEITGNILHLASFIFPVSSGFFEKFGKNLEVKAFYDSNKSTIDPEGELLTWFLRQQQKIENVVFGPKIEMASYQMLASVAPRPQIPPKPAIYPEMVEKADEGPPPIPKRNHPPPIPVRNNPGPSPPQIQQLKPKFRTVKQIKKPDQDRKNRLSLNTEMILDVMDQYFPSFNYLELMNRMVKPLSEGAFGQTFLVKAKEFDVPVVAKIFKHSRHLEVSAQKELVNLVKCSFHPQIVKIYGKITGPTGIMGLVLEYMEGGTVFDVIYKEKEDYPEKQLLLWLKHASSALLFLHSKDLIHRDIKPSNLLLSSKSEQRILKLGDFGSLKAFQVDQYNEPKTLAGTSGYVAPEIQLGKSQSAGLTPAVDVYSLGITMWEMAQKLRPDKEENQIFNESARTWRPKLDNPRYIWVPSLVSRMWEENFQLRPSIATVHDEITKLYDLSA